MNDFLCGAVAGAAADTCLFPFDTVRARMMTRSSHVKGGVLLEMMNLIRLDGARALYKGLPAHLLACIPGNGVFYFTYQAAKEAMEAHVHSEAARHAISASLGCLASLVIYTPMEVVKQRVMVSNTVGSRLMLQNILAQGGVRELYRGFAAGALTWVPYLSLYFLLYESLLNRLPRALTDPKHNADSPSHLSEEVPFFAALGCGVAAGFGAAALTNPFDVVRTKIQTGGISSPSSPFGMARRIAQREGVRGFARGMVARCMLLAPTSSLTVALFTSFKALAEKRKRKALDASR